jgi:hypothetical protein
MTRPIFCAAALGCGLLAWAQDDSNSGTSRFRIAGRVINSSTGEPVPRATVAALSEDNRTVASAVSDADGKFSIDHLPAGKYPLDAARRGFRTAFYDEHDSFNSAIVTGDGQDTEHLQFALAPAAVLRGIVTGDGGDPVEGANVMLFRRPDPSQTNEPVRQVDGTVTDDTGTYEFGNLSAGEYYLAVEAEPWYALHHHSIRNSDNPDANLDLAYPITFFDSTIDDAAAAPIALDDGSREEANISMHAVPALRLRLHGATRHRGARPIELRETVFGNPIQSHGVMAIQRGELETSGIAPGHYQLTHGDPPRTVELDATSDLEVDANAGLPAVSVAGTLRDSTGATIAEDASLVLEPTDGARRSPLAVQSHKGQFQFDEVLPGRWSLTVSVSQDGQSLPVMSTGSGTSRSPGNEIAVGDRPLNIAVAVTRAHARVLGFARINGKPASGVMVVLVPRSPAGYPALVRRDQSDSDGSFSLSGVAPGQYTVIAIEDGWKLDWQKRESIAKYLAGGLAIAVGDRPNAVIQLPQPVAAVPR